MSFVVSGGRYGATRAVDACRLATLASSLGGVETPIPQPVRLSALELDDDALAALGIHPALVRLSVGGEETKDVVGDVPAGLDGARDRAVRPHRDR